MESLIERAGKERNAQKWRVLTNVPAKLLQFLAAEPGVDAEEEDAETVDPGFIPALAGSVSFDSIVWRVLFGPYRFLFLNFSRGKKTHETHL